VTKRKSLNNDLEFGWHSLQQKRAGTLESELTANEVNIGIITEAEIPASSHGDFNVEGYHSYLPHSSDLLKSAKYRIVTLVRSSLATSAKIWLNLMHMAVQSIWIQLDLAQSTPRRKGTPGPPGPRVLIGGLYREWLDLALETTALSQVREQLQAASAEVDNVVLAGDVNLNTARRYDVRYSLVPHARPRQCGGGRQRVGRRQHEVLGDGHHIQVPRPAREGRRRSEGARVHPRPHLCVKGPCGHRKRAHRHHHRPLLASVLVDKLTPSNKSIEHRNFKKLSPRTPKSA
jgi:hypothetical protein